MRFLQEVRKHNT